MTQTLRYIILFVVTMLLQTLFFDRLTIGVWFAPMIYTALVILLPVNAPSIVNLLSGLAAGVAADLFAGTAGLNTAAILVIAYVRRPLLEAIVGHEGMRDGRVPSSESMGLRRFANYLVTMVFLHGFIFYLLEVFSTGHILYTLLRFGAGSLSSLLFVWIAALLFTRKESERV